MIIEATFIGTPSLGYKTGSKYKLIIPDFRGMTIKRLDGTGTCPYQSLSVFLKNWTNIKLI